MVPVEFYIMLFMYYTSKINLIVIRKNSSFFVSIYKCRHYEPLPTLGKLRNGEK